MNPSWLSLLHGFLFGIPILVLVGHGVVVCWQDTLDFSNGCLNLKISLQQRFRLWNLLAWATLLSGVMCAWWRHQPLRGALWVWKIGCGAWGTLLLTHLTFKMRRWAQSGREREPALSDLVLAEGGFLIAALLGALSHYFP